METRPTAEERERYLLDALDVVRREALHADRVDWAAALAEARETAARAEDYPGTHRLLGRLLREAGGPHSHLVAPRARRLLGQRPPLMPQAEVADGVGLLALPRMSGGRDLAHRYARAGDALLRSLAPACPGGVVVDLRENTGGNMWPMLAAVAGLLGPGVVGHFVHGDRWQPWRRGRWSVANGRRPVARARGRRLTVPRFAVLTSARTASAGEAVLVALRGEPGARVFGAPSAGMTTGNATHVLRDGTRMHISTAHYADRDRRLVAGSIAPDAPAEDARAAALAWLRDVAR